MKNSKSHQKAIKMKNEKELECVNQEDENTKNLSSCNRSKNKKRNDQNITRTIVRRLKGLN